MNRLLIHYVDGENIYSVIEKVKTAIKAGATKGKNSEFNFTLDAFAVEKKAKKKARILTYADIQNMNHQEMEDFLSEKDHFQDLDRVEAELLLTEYAEEWSDKDVILRAMVENRITELFVNQ